MTTQVFCCELSRWRRALTRCCALGTLIYLSLGCSGTTTLPDHDVTQWTEVGEDGHFMRPLSTLEARRQARAYRQRLRRKRTARAAARRSRSKLVGSTRPAGPSTWAHKTPHWRAKRLQSLSVSGAGRRGDKVSRRVQTARRFVGRTDLGRRPFVDVVLRAAGQRLKIKRKPFASGLHRWLKSRRKLVRASKARAGDIVLFAKTHDLNGNGRPDDGITWAGIVEQVSHGRIVFIAHRAGKVRRMAATPHRRRSVRDGDKVLNTKLVRWPGAKRALTAGECLSVVGRL